MLGSYSCPGTPHWVNPPLFDMSFLWSAVVDIFMSGNHLNRSPRASPKKAWVVGERTNSPSSPAIGKDLGGWIH